MNIGVEETVMPLGFENAAAPDVEHAKTKVAGLPEYVGIVLSEVSNTKALPQVPAARFGVVNVCPGIVWVKSADAA